MAAAIAALKNGPMIKDGYGWRPKDRHGWRFARRRFSNRVVNIMVDMGVAKRTVRKSGGYLADRIELA